MCSRSGISCVQNIEGICVPRSEMCILYVEEICVICRQCVFCIWTEHVFLIRKECVLQVQCVQYMKGICVPRSLCSESGRNYEFHVRNCVLYMEGVCVFDQECEIFFLMEYSMCTQ